jgi:hypothetical protein
MSIVFETVNDIENKFNRIDSAVQYKLDKTVEIKIQNVFDMVASGRVNTRSE